jgi:hypothetical protein
VALRSLLYYQYLRPSPIFVPFGVSPSTLHFWIAPAKTKSGGLLRLFCRLQLFSFLAVGEAWRT